MQLHCYSARGTLLSWVIVIPVASQGSVFGTCYLIHSEKQVKVFVICGQAHI